MPACLPACIYIRSDGIDALAFQSTGDLPPVTVHATQPSAAALMADGGLDRTIAAQPHLAFQLSPDFVVGFSSSAGNSSSGGRTLAQIQTALAAARRRELSSYGRFGALSETKRAVQSSVMWQVIYNPLEQGPLAPVIRGNPYAQSIRIHTQCSRSEAHHHTNVRC